MPSARLLLISGLLLCLAVPLTAQQVRLETLSGSTYDGIVLSDDGTTVKLETTDGATMSFQHEGLTPISQFRLRRLKIADGDAAANLALAEWCVDVALYPQARQSYRAALAAGPQMEAEINASITEARSQASKDVLKRAQDLMAANKNDEARALLTQLVQELPLEPASEEAAKLLADDLTQRKAAAAVVRDTDPTDGKDTSRRFSDEAYAMFAKTVEHYQKMLDLTHKGLTSKSQSNAIDDFEKGLKEVENARKEADKAVARGGTAPPDLDAALTEIDAKLQEADADLRIHIADAYLLRSSYKQASDVINQGLAKNPRSPRLLSARERVTAAASSNDNGWVIGGGRLR